jgi:hypothetical protein
MRNERPVTAPCQPIAAAAASVIVGALAVGAAAYKLTPGYGTNPAQIEPFSSSGQTPVMFTAAGVRLPTPQLLEKPDVVGPDGTGEGAV